MALTITVPAIGVTTNVASYTVAADVDVGGLVDALTGSGVGLTDGAAGAVVDNEGQIVSTGILATILGVPIADAVDLTAGGTVDNDLTAAANIAGSADGVHVTGGAGIIANAARSTISGADIGVGLGAGGTVGNAANGTITGGTVGAAIAGTAAGAASALRNLGTIQATAANGIGASIDAGALSNGGTIAAIGTDGIGATVGTGSAGNTGTISGTLNGLVETGAAALTNGGIISGTAGSGVTLAGGGLTNAAGATITGGVSGLGGAAGLVDNLGTITATAANGTGAALTAGDLTNAVGATISATGAGGVGVSLAGPGTLINAGTIAGTPATAGAPAVAVSLTGDGSKLTLDAGQILDGSAIASGTGASLELAAGANGAANVISDIGSTIRGFGQAAVDAGVDAVVTGGLTASPAAPLTVSLGDGASLAVGGPVASGVSIDLDGAGATLSLGDAADFKGTIADFGTGDTLDLTGLGAGTTVSYAPGSGLTITAPTGASTLLPVTLPAGATLSLSPGGLGVVVGTGAGGSGLTVTTGTGAGSSPGTGGGTGTGPGTGGGAGIGAGTNAGGDSQAGTVTVAADPTTGGSTVTTTSPLGATSTQELPPGSALAQNGSDLISIDPYAHYNGGTVFPGRGGFVITGHVAAGSGVSNVTISASIDGGDQTVLGTAKVAADGSYSLLDKVGPHLQAFITATETDALGNTLSVGSPYSLQAGTQDGSFRAEQDLYTPDGSAVAGITKFRSNGSRRTNVTDGGQTFVSDHYDTFNDFGRANNTFVFEPGYGQDVITQFRLANEDHDIVSLPSQDFQNLAAVLADTRDTASGALITAPTSGDTLKLLGITKAEMKANPNDFAFHP